MLGCVSRVTYGDTHDMKEHVRGKHLSLPGAGEVRVGELGVCGAHCARRVVVSLRSRPDSVLSGTHDPLPQAGVSDPRLCGRQIPDDARVCRVSPCLPGG